MDRSDRSLLLIPLKVAASRLSMSRQSVMNYVNRGSLLCVRLARNSVYFRPQDLDDFIERHIEKRSPLTIDDNRKRGKPSHMLPR